MEKYKEGFIEFMVKAGVLKFGEFKTKSGRMAPYFVNTGDYKTGQQISKLGEFYAECIKDNVKDDYDVLFGPAYKGIPLVVTTAVALANRFEENKAYSFNRKEKKDHGEGGSIVGHIPSDNEKVLIIEDVVTAGTSVRESVALLNKIADVDIFGLVISVDRMEKGPSGKSATQELADKFGISTYSIVNIKEIVDYLYNREIDGRIVIDNNMKNSIEEYLLKYGV
ncbi:MAG: orotate phosphoribosyltransferase [bacterium]